MIDITKFYDEQAETGFGNLEYYKPIYEILNEIVSPDSVADLGCRTGYLISNFKDNGADVLGVDYFEYNKKRAHGNIQDDFIIHDLRTPLTVNKKYDLVVSTEVGEHIDKEYEIQYLDNIKSLMHENSKLIISWSPDGSDDQHLNALSKEQFIKLLTDNGLKINKDLTSEFLIKSGKTTIVSNFNWYFFGNISLWELQ